jgi:acetoin utilization protein AcuB
MAWDMAQLTIRAFMTAAPFTIDAAQSIDAALQLMHAHHIRHLPVLDGERLVGVVSERDLALARGLPGAVPTQTPVAQAMSPDPRALSPESSLEWVAAEMAQQKIGSVVVIERGRVIGIFTTVDALRALGELLARSRRRRRHVRSLARPRLQH